MSRGTLEEAWKVIEKIRDILDGVSQDVHGLKIESEHCKKNQESTDKKIDLMCQQLVVTEREVVGKIETSRKESSERNDQIVAELRLLKDAYLLREGIAKGESKSVGFMAEHGIKLLLAITAIAFFAGIYVSKGII